MMEFPEGKSQVQTQDKNHFFSCPKIRCGHDTIKLLLSNQNFYTTSVDGNQLFA